MKITEKGQITIPIEIREKYGFLPHTEIEFIEFKGKIYLRKISGKKSRGKSLIRHMKGSATVKMTTNEILALTRGKNDRDTN